MFYADSAYGGSGRSYTNDAAPVTGFKNGGHDPLFELALEDFGAMMAFFVANGVGNLSTIATSASSNSVTVGSKTFTVGTGKAFGAGLPILISRTSAPQTTAMAGVITGYSGGVVSVTITRVVGSGGPFTDWSLAVVPLTPVSYLPTYTFTQLLALTGMGQGDVAFTPDVGVDGTEWIYVGTRWKPIGGSLLLAQRSGNIATPLATISGATSGTFAISAISVPANLLRVGSRIRVGGLASRSSSVSALATFSIKLAAAVIATSDAEAVAGTRYCHLFSEAYIGSGLNNLASTLGVPSGASAPGSGGGSIVLSNANAITVDLSNANAGNSHSLLGLYVQVFP